MALALVVGDAFAVDEDDLEVLLVDPDLALEVALVLLEDLGAGGEDVGVELVDLLAAEVFDVVLGEVVGGEDERQAVLDVVEVGWGHHDALEGVLGCEDDVLVAAAVRGEGDVSDLLVLAVDLVGVFGEGVHLDRLAEGVTFAGFAEGGFTLTEFSDDLLGGETGWGGGVEGAGGGEVGGGGEGGGGEGGGADGESCGCG